ncbi:uncharacterized protein LOC127777048 [Oryza glaberrima]|uniref:uncharacterized protein LOC127777048 n=1 Tax=Oryza glaberrima TaxID=4538 RepID=UPI00224C5C8E|nr:uncharacterized protein LOC127777048 [Oryza glaberrima]
MILFTTWTEIEECIGGPADFPTIVYSLTSYNDVPNLVGNADRFVDVVGVITEITTPTMLRPKSREADSLKRTVQICDANNSILNVALWGERALAFQAEDIYNAGKKEPQIVLFVGTLVKDYTKSGIGLALSGCSACKWYINIDIPEIAELKKKLGEKLQPIKWVETAATVYEDDTVEQKTVAELKKLNPHKCRRLRFITSVTIRKFCNENSWWYRSCQKCFKGAKPYGYTYKCGSCSWIGMATPRYKLALTASDDSDNAEFILFGKTAQRLVRKPIEALIDKIPEGSNFIPDEITCLLEKQFVWNVSITENSLRNCEVSFQVNSIISGDTSGQPLLLMSPTSSQTSSAMMSPGSSSALLSPTKVIEVGCSSPPSTATASPSAAISTPKKQALQPSTPHTSTSKFSCAPTEQKAKVVAVHDKTLSPVAPSPASATTSKKRVHPSQTTPPVKKLFNEDNNKEKDETDSAPADA